MPNRSKSSENRTLSQFDRGPVQILEYFSTLNKPEVITIQMLVFALLEVLSLRLTDNDPYKSDLFSQFLINVLQASKILPISMSLSAKSIRQLPLFQNYVRTLQGNVQTALNIIQRPSSSSDQPSITSVLEKEYAKVLLTTTPATNLNIEIPQADLQLKVPLPLMMNGTITTNDFDNIVVFRYVQDFYELDKLGKGAFGSVFRARNRLDDRAYAIKKIVFNENTDRTRRQAKHALREVRVLASLCHPNIVQYHCAWLELVPVETRPRPTSSSSASSQTKKTISVVQKHDSLDELIRFEGQSTSDVNSKSVPNNSTSQDDDSEVSVFESNGEQIFRQSYSDGDHPSVSSSTEIVTQHSAVTTREIIPIQKPHATNQSYFSSAKLVLFIQMQLCDTTLYDWLRYRDHVIIEEIPAEEKKNFFTLNELGQNQCWNIFKQLLTAVEYLHSQLFVHRDIKPRNVFLAYGSNDSSSVHVKLGDFGLTTLFDSELTPDSPEQFQNDESTGVGTALYAPPEQLNSKHSIATKKSDSYSLGIVLYELFNIFPTEMERCRWLSDLRVHLKVDEEFAKCYPFETKIIERLVSIDWEERPNVDELLTIYNTEVQQRTKRQQSNKKQRIIEQLEKKLCDKDRRIQQLELELEKNKS